ncbi:hypothetical protein Q8A67_001701 [Cirrhinus molitorella]|uniref:Ig-like domain-containing protein n=1 Tax=Cirrhinus molitorella TaxID=172907 RepID=A0AA88Q4M8_9TELE|nr:hypothetical protein Q8A67_001701 [Cirrhinus molitorella]
MGSSALSLALLLMLLCSHSGLTEVDAKPEVKVSPDQHVFRGETVTFTCDIQGGGNIQWTYSWFKDGSVLPHVTERVYTITSDESNSGKYSCEVKSISDDVTLTVSERPKPVVKTSERYTVNRDTLTIRQVIRSDQDQYWCRGQRDEGPKSSHLSSAISLTVTGVSPSVSLEVSPSRSQHFSSDSLSLSCEDQSNSAGWTVRRYTDRNTEDCSKQTGSTCRIVSLSTSDTGVYWCQSESGEKRHPLNITVHDGDVILVSSVDPVIEGDTLTLHCLHRSTNSPILRADFYKDGSLVQNQTTGELSITSVSKSHEGFYYCKTERGQSLHSWISVRGDNYSLLRRHVRDLWRYNVPTILLDHLPKKCEADLRSHSLSVLSKHQNPVLNILSFLLAACPYLLATIVLLFKCYRRRVPSAEDQRQYAVTEGIST